MIELVIDDILKKLQKDCKKIGVYFEVGNEDFEEFLEELREKLEELEQLEQ